MQTAHQLRGSFDSVGLLLVDGLKEVSGMARPYAHDTDQLDDHLQDNILVKVGDQYETGATTHIRYPWALRRG